MECEPQFLEVGGGADRRRIAYRAEFPTEPAPPPVNLMWLSGFKSDMASTKATALAAWARGRGLGCVRFDYSGHGASDGRFEDGTIGRWLDEAVAVFAKVALPPSGTLRDSPAPLVIVGSSMGAHIALLLLRRLREEAPEAVANIVGLVLIAPAWDMTEALIWNAMSEEDRARLLTTGVYSLPSPFGEPTPITRTFIEEGRCHLLANRAFDPGCPVRVIQGLRDEDVPPDHARRLARVLMGRRVELMEIADGDHRLSRPEDLELLFEVIEGLACRAG